MFARRVFELMSSNTLVVSNYSRGTSEMFGDLIVYPDKEPDRLRSLSDDEIEKLRSRALLHVLGEHTYTQRWHEILTKIGLPFAPRVATLTFVSKVRHRSDALSAIAWYQQYGQIFAESRLLVVATDSMADLDVASLYKEFNRFGVTVTSHSHATRYAMLGRYQPVETSHFVTIDSIKPPKPVWIKNALLHLQYMHSHPIAMAEQADMRYRIDFLSERTTLIDAAHRFEIWLEKESFLRQAYFV
jgi:hypothetical protein